LCIVDKKKYGKVFLFSHQRRKVVFTPIKMSGALPTLIFSSLPAAAPFLHAKLKKQTLFASLKGKALTTFSQNQPCQRRRASFKRTQDEIFSTTALLKFLSVEIVMRC
jgi:hypothetical protein